MDCILNSTRAVLLSNLFSDCLPFLSGIVCQQLDACAQIGHQELGCLSALLLVLLQETGCRCRRELTHLKAADIKSTPVDLVNDLASIRIHVRLQ